MKTITHISAAALHSDVTICDEAEDGSRDGFETIRIEHDLGARGAERLIEIEQAVNALTQ